jgi:hypothetical protein
VLILDGADILTVNSLACSRIALGPAASATLT